jgi:hypothetical protein
MKKCLIIFALTASMISNCGDKKKNQSPNIAACTEEYLESKEILGNQILKLDSLGLGSGTLTSGGNVNTNDTEIETLRTDLQNLLEQFEEDFKDQVSCRTEVNGQQLTLSHKDVVESFKQKISE